MSRKTSMAVRAGAVSAAALLVLTACGNGNGDDEAADDAEATNGDEVIRVAIAGERPYSYFNDDGEAEGATIALAEEIFGEMGYTVEAEVTDWDSLIPGLSADRFDAVSAGMSILPERCEEADFAEPEIMYTTALLVEELPPYERHDKKSGWYKGTANAIYQNIDFIDRYDPDYVVILSGDHIYKMDYAAMVEYHEKNQASCTIAVRNVPLAEASRFGILNTNPDMSIYEFEEKPARPKSTNASMGIYVFNWQVLKAALIEDEDDPKSSNDFGKNIIPNLLNQGHKMMAYPFDGYWKDVGTINSLWEANMELLGKDPVFNLRGERFKIYARNSALPSSFIASSAKTVDCFIAEGSEVEGEVRHSVVSVGCKIGPGAVVEDSVVMPGVVVEAGAIVRHAILGENSRVCKNAVVGGAYGPGEEMQISVTSKGSVVEENAVLKPGEMM